MTDTRHDHDLWAAIEKALPVSRSPQSDSTIIASMMRGSCKTTKPSERRAPLCKKPKKKKVSASMRTTIVSIACTAPSWNVVDIILP